LAVAPLRASAASTTRCESFYSISSEAFVQDRQTDPETVQCAAHTGNTVSNTSDVELLLRTPQGDLIGTTTDNFTLTASASTQVSGDLGTFRGRASGTVSLNQAYHSYSGVQVDVLSSAIDGQSGARSLLQTGGSVPGTPVGSIVDVNVLGASILSSSTGQFTDTFTLVLPNAPANTMIMFSVLSVLSAGTTVNDCSHASARADSNLLVETPIGAALGGSFATVGACGIGPSVPPGPAFLSAPVGSTLVLDGQFRISVSAGTSGSTGVTLSDSSVEAGNTAHYYLDVLTPGASAVTGSGVDYSSPVPEPSTALLAALGLTGVAAACRRRT
jgi:hypothetical protein